MELFDYQKNTIEKAIDYFTATKDPYPKFNIFFKMGLGKTITSIEIVKRLRPKTVLIVCPKSLIEMWVYEFFKYFGTAYIRVDKIEYLNNYNIHRIFIVNYEQLLSLKTMIQPDVCIFDEVHRLKNINSKIHKTVNKYIMPNRTLCLTGTPITKDLMDLYGILTCVGYPAFDNMTPMQFKYKYIINGGTNKTAYLQYLISPHTVILDYENTLDMPDTEDIVIPIKLPIEDRHKLRQICIDTTKNPLARITEAQQYTSGIPNGIKLVFCKQLISDILDDGDKVVLFVKYRAEYEYFMNYYKDICVGIDGSTKDRDTPIYEFKNNPNIKIFVGNIQTAGLGISLTAAHKCIFYSETYTWGDDAQIRGRIYRADQKHTCIYYHLLCLDTIDTMIYNSTQNKTNLIEDFTKSFGGAD